MLRSPIPGIQQHMTLLQGLPLSDTRPRNRTSGRQMPSCCGGGGGGSRAQQALPSGGSTCTSPPVAHPAFWGKARGSSAHFVDVLLETSAFLIAGAMVYWERGGLAPPCSALMLAAFLEPAPPSRPKPTGLRWTNVDATLSCSEGRPSANVQPMPARPETPATVTKKGGLPPLWVELAHFTPEKWGQAAETQHLLLSMVLSTPILAS